MSRCPGPRFTVEAITRPARRFATRAGHGHCAVATDAAGASWLVLVAGASTVARTGLRRSDVLFRTLGEAAVLTTAGAPVLVLTADLPVPRSAAIAALRAARGVTLVGCSRTGAPGVDARLARLRRRRHQPVGDLLPGR